MTTLQKRKQIIQEISVTSKGMLDELYDYLQYLKIKRHQSEHIQTDMASESVLAKDWLKPEEDKAWANL